MDKTKSSQDSEQVELVRVDAHSQAKEDGDFVYFDTFLWKKLIDVSDGAVLLYQTIIELTRKYGDCPYKNRKFAEWLGTCETTVSRYISLLKERGLIETDYEVTDRGNRRHLIPFVTREFIERVNRGGSGSAGNGNNNLNSGREVSEKQREIIINKWNSAEFVRDKDESAKPDKLPRIIGISKDMKRYSRLCKCFYTQTFDMDEIIAAYEEQPFLYRKSEDEEKNLWGRADFDWLIKKPGNHLNVIQRFYS